MPLSLFRGEVTPDADPPSKPILPFITSGISGATVGQLIMECLKEGSPASRGNIASGNARQLWYHQEHECWVEIRLQNGKMTIELGEPGV